MKLRPGNLPLIILVLAMLITIFTVTVSAGPGNSVHNLNTDTDYSTIYEAVYDANNGDTIQIYSGDYSGDGIDVYGKHLHFRGVDSGSGLPRVEYVYFGPGTDGSSLENLIFFADVSLYETANTLIRNCQFDGGRIYSEGATYTTIEECRFYNPQSNSKFIDLEYFSNHTVVRDCSFDIGGSTPGTAGKIFVDSSGDFSMIDAVLTGCAIYMYNSHNVTLRDTTCTDDATEFSGVDGLVIEGCSIAGMNQPIAALYVADSANVSITGSQVSGGRIAISLERVNNATIAGTGISGTSYYGITLQDSRAIIVSGCEVRTNSQVGIALWSNSEIRISDNVIAGNQYGFFLPEAGSNLDVSVYNNTFENRDHNVYYDDTPAIADDGFTYNTETSKAYQYHGTRYTGYLGNYWSDYTGEDTNGDGIGESAYVADGVVDHYPLAEQSGHYLTDLAIPKVQFSVSSAGVTWGNSYTVRVTRTGDASGACSIDLAVAGGNADPDQDYQASDVMPYTVNFAPGETQETFVVSTYADYSGMKENKNIVFGLSNPRDASLGSQDSLNLIISHSLLQVRSVNPLDGSDYVPTDTAIEADFDSDLATVAPESFTLTDPAGSRIDGSIAIEYGTATFRPASPLANGVRYTARLTGILDANGYPLASDFSWSFTTEPVAPEGKVELVRGNTVLNTRTDIQSILNYWDLRNGDVVRISSGIYHEKRLLIYGKSITIRGLDTGWGKPIIDSDGDTGFLLRASGVTFENLRIRNASDYNIVQVGAISASQSNDLTVKDCVFDNCYASIEMPATSTGGPLFGNDNVDVINCTFNTGISGGQGVYSYYGTDITIDGCTFNGQIVSLIAVDGAVISDSSFRGYGLSIFNDGPKNTDNVKVTGCTFADGGLNVNGYAEGSECVNYEVTDCTLLENGRITISKCDGINIHDNNVISGQISVQICKNAVIRNINDQLDTVADNVDAGIVAYYCPGVIIDNAHVRLYHEGSGGQGAISVSQSDDAVIRNCISSDSFYSGPYGVYTTDGISVVNSNRVTVENSNASGNGGRGIYLYHQNGYPACDDNIIINCIVNDNFYDAGIVIDGANGNIITGNTVLGNRNGIKITGGSGHSNTAGHDNRVYNNTIACVYGNNGADASAPGTNRWYSPGKIDYEYNGHSFNNYVGNFWGDYEGTDSTGDGIGDTPYTRANVVDNYPMTRTSVVAQPSIEFTVASMVADEGTTAHVMLHRSGDTSDYSYVDVSYIGGTAIRGVNYTFVNVTITFTPAQEDSGFDVSLPANSVVEPADTYVNFSLSDPDNAVLGDQVMCNLTIHDTSAQADTTPPVTTFSYSGTAGTNDWNTSNVIVFLDAVDADSGVRHIAYQLDGAAWAIVAGADLSFSISDSGVHTLRFNSTDNPGNREADQTVIIKIDKEAPTFAYHQVGTAGYDGWYKNNVTVMIEAADTVSGVYAISYRLDMTPWVIIPDSQLSLDLTDNGVHTFRFNVTDYAGNRYSDQIATFKIDGAVPATAASFAGTAGSHGWYRSAVTVTLNANDASGSGVATTYYQVDSLGWNVYNPSSKPVIGEGEHIITYYSVDNLGNAETARSSTVKVDTTPPTVVSTTPSSDAVDISLSAMITVRFSEDIDPATFSGTVRDSEGNLIIGLPSYAENVITFDPSSPLSRATTYVATVDDVKDVAGNPMADTIGWSFRTIPFAPVAGFVANRTYGFAPMGVQFNDTSTLAPTSWSWDFGDGVTSSERNPQHTFVSQGNYLVTLTVSNNGGSDAFQQQVTAAPEDRAEVISIDCPAELIMGRENAVLVTLKNTGDTTWSYHEEAAPGHVYVYDLKFGAGSGYDMDEYYGVAMTKTRSGDVVAPGETVTYTLNLNPSIAGSYTIKCRMLGVVVYDDGAREPRYFGENATLNFTARKAIDNAMMDSYSCPTEMLTGRSYTIWVMVRNTGESTWTPRTVELANMMDTDTQVYSMAWYLDNLTYQPNDAYYNTKFTWSMTPSDNEVQPGEGVIYTYNFTPLSNALGNHTLSFRMLGLGDNDHTGAYFGDTASRNVTFRDPADNAIIISINCPDEFITGKDNNVTVVLKNTGETTWRYQAAGPLYNFFSPYDYQYVYDLKVWNQSVAEGSGRPDYINQVAIAKTRSKDTVAPGETVTYTFRITPNPQGYFTRPLDLRFQVLGLNYPGGSIGAYFGEQANRTVTIREPIENAQILSFDCPSEFITGRENNITVVLKNTGETTWNYHQVTYPGYVPYTIQTIYDLKMYNNSGMNSENPDYYDHMSVVKRRSKDVVAPGETVTYTINVTPDAQWFFDPLDLRFRMLGTTPGDTAPRYFGELRAKGVVVRSPAQSARVLSVTGPGDVMFGRESVVTIVVKNTGETTWNYHQEHLTNFLPGYENQYVFDLKVWNQSSGFSQDSPDYIYGMSVAKSRSKDVVAPNDTATYTFRLTPDAYGTVRLFDLRFQMLGTPPSNPYAGVYFGDQVLQMVTPRMPVDNAQLISVIQPAEMVVGQESTVVITMKNTGDTTWEKGKWGVSFDGNGVGSGLYTMMWSEKQYVFTDYDPVTNLSAIITPSRTIVAPNETVQYTVKVTPLVNGHFVIYCRMLGSAAPSYQSSYAVYFGEAAIVQVDTVAPHVTSVFPADRAADALPGDTIRATFDQDMNVSSLEAGFRLYDNANNRLAGSVTYGGRTATFTPARPLVNGEYYTMSLDGVKDVNGARLSLYSWGFRVVYRLPSPNPTGNPTPRPSLIPTPIPQPFTMTIQGVSVTVDGDQITGPAGSDLSKVLTGGQVTIPAGSGTLTLDISVSSPKNTGTITGVHVSDQSSGTVSGSAASVSATADLDGLPSGSVRFSVTISDPPADLSGFTSFLGGKGRSLSTPLAMIEVDKSGFTNDDIVGGTAKITLTMKKPADFNPTKTYTVVRQGDDGYEQLTAVVKSTTATDVTFEIESPNGFSTFLLAETAAAATSVPTMTPPPSATPVPAPGFLLIGLAIVAGAMVGMRTRKK